MKKNRKAVENLLGLLTNVQKYKTHRNKQAFSSIDTQGILLSKNIKSSLLSFLISVAPKKTIQRYDQQIFETVIV